MKGTLVKNRHVLLQERGLVGEEGGEGCYQHSFPLIRWSVLQRGSPEGTLLRSERILHLNNLCTSSFWLSGRAESRSSVSVPPESHLNLDALSSQTGDEAQSL